MLRKRNAHKNNVARRFAGTKAQSAMEYLMTYGWAILIIAVVLGALFQLGVFNSSSFLGTGCIAQPGFYCNNPVLSTSGVLTVTVGQDYRYNVPKCIRLFCTWRHKLL